jgi:hypothetical protein
MTNHRSIALNKAFKLAFGRKFQITPKEPTMPIIAAVWESDTSILLAADSGQVEVMGGFGLRTISSQKLKRHPKGFIAWGATGDPRFDTKGFSTWLAEYRWPPQNWNQLKLDIESKVATTNGRRREVAKMAGVPVIEENLLSVIVVGWIADEGNVLMIDDRGCLFVINYEQRFISLGSGAFHAALIDLALEKAGAPGTCLEKLTIVMEIRKTLLLRVVLKHHSLLVHSKSFPYSICCPFLQKDSVLSATGLIN